MPAMKKHGTFKGVFVPSTEAILGTVLFLLLPALVLNAGLPAIIIIILAAHSITIATAFSLADCATNVSHIGHGGMYSLCRLSLGKAFGGSIGIQLFIAQAASIGFYAIGFTEPVFPLLSSFISASPIAAFDPATQKQIISTAVLLLFFIIVMYGADFTLKVQLLILFILVLSIGSIFAAPFLGLNSQGVPLFSMTLDKIKNHGLIHPLSLSALVICFTQFFPAVTGIDAGVGMSGDLENPKKSLVKGTFAAIFLTMAVYLISAVIFGGLNPSAVISYTDENHNPVFRPLNEIMGMSANFPGNIPGVFIFLGIIFATSSSALSCLMTAPRTLRSLANDNLLPKKLNFLKFDFFKNGKEPRVALCVAFFIALLIIWIGSISTAATVVGICFLVVYGWVNASAFLERFSGNPNFRPTNRGHWLISFYGFAASLAAILMFSPITGISILIAQLILFELILRYKTHNRLEGIWWGVLYAITARTLAATKTIIMGSKNWRPLLSAIAVSNNAPAASSVSWLSGAIASYKGMVDFNIILPEKEKIDLPETQWAIKPGFIRSENPNSVCSSILQMRQATGMDCNTFLLEFEKNIDLIKLLKKADSLKKNVLVLKTQKDFKSRADWISGGVQILTEI